ncbi:protein of unknown function [Cyclobacterium lianum]|uniref:DUF4221 domain-containing protein n=1 Tax=Cyclobacterium lianum TaxID=388280 RepID=A0A1M7INW5_9BACT|nr:DUF4221 family protein [Cyclobacterium lianum]SHM42313.1 protein of unknown function [Cyclobacterium lianum]
MRHCFYRSIFVFIIACSSPDEVGLTPLEIATDTVMVDPGEEILFLNFGLWASDLSDDKKYLYNVNSQEYAIEKINLNTLTFEKRYPFEREGPNGVGNFLRTFALINNDSLFISFHQNEHLFNWQGEKLKSFDIIEMGKEQGQLAEGDKTYKTISLSQDGSQYASLIVNSENKNASFALIDHIAKTFHKIALPGMEKTKDYELTLKEGQGILTMGLGRYLSKEGGNVIVGTEVSNELYVLDNTSGELNHIAYNNQLTPNEKSGNYPTEFGDRVQYSNFHRKIMEDISFMNPVWDEKKQVYYRFSYQMKYDDNAKPKDGQLYTPTTGADVYLSVLDKDFKLIAESHLQSMDERPPFHFAKDGKLWFFENLEDEMGFVRMDITW